MPKRQKRRTRRERVVTKHLHIGGDGWGKVCSIRWTPTTRPVIAALFGTNGGFAAAVEADKACEGSWSRVMNANRLLIQHGLPYRIRGYGLPDAKKRERKSGSWISGRGLQLHTVTKTL